MPSEEVGERTHRRLSLNQTMFIGSVVGVLGALATAYSSDSWLGPIAWLVAFVLIMMFLLRHTEKP